MYICEDCGAIFEKPIKGYDIEKDSCPRCGSWGVVPARRCSVCGELMSSKGLDTICEDCKDEFKKALDGFIGIYADAMKISRNDVADLIMDCVG